MKSVNEPFINSIITDSILSNIPTMKQTSFDVSLFDKKDSDKGLIELTSKQLSFFFSKAKIKQTRDYFDEEKFYFFGKKPLGETKLAMFIIVDAGYQGRYLYCSIIERNGKLQGKFLCSYLDVDSDCSNLSKGEFINDSIYKFSESRFSYIDNEHKSVSIDSVIHEVYIGKVIKFKIVKGFPVDTLY